MIKQLPNDDTILKAIKKTYASAQTTCIVVSIFIILSYELIHVIPLPITGGSMSMQLGVAPLITSSMFYGFAATEFRIEKKILPSKLYSDVFVCAVYAVLWCLPKISYSSWGAELVDGVVLFLFTCVLRYVDILVSGLTNEWISLIHANLCIRYFLELVWKSTSSLYSAIAIAVAFTCAWYMVRSSRSVQLNSTKYKNMKQTYNIPWLYNGSTSIIYAGTAMDSVCNPIIQSLADRTQLTWKVADIVNTPVLEHLDSSLIVSVLAHCMLILFFEINLPAMQQRDAKGVLQKFKSESLGLAGWRHGEAAERYLDNKIDKTRNCRMLVLICAKLTNLLGVVVVCEQLKELKIIKQVRLWIPRCIRAPFNDMFR